MGTIFKKSITRPLPTGAVIKIVRRRAKASELKTNPSQKSINETIAEWTDRSGKVRTAGVTRNGIGEYRIKAESATWTAKYRDGDGVVREVATGCREKQAAQAVLQELMKRAELIKANIMTSDQSQVSDFQRIPLSEHIEEYIAHLKDRSVHPQRIKTTDNRLKESSDGCKFRYLRDMEADRLRRWLNEQISSEERSMSAAVYNSYVQMWVSFGNWCIGKRIEGKRSSMDGTKRMIANPFAGMGKLDERADRRRKARALSETELIALLAAARRRPLDEAKLIRRGKRKGEPVAELSAERIEQLERLGLERALIYKVAILTGLRLNELRTLCVGDLSFGDIPFVKLRSSNEKNRRGSTLALRADLAVDLRQWCLGKAATEAVFNVPAGLLRIMNRDLAAAGIPKKDAEGYVVHVHALRHSFGTHLSLAGVAPRVAQAAMRHSNISLTMNTYTDPRLLDTAAAVEALPDLPLNQPTVAPTVAPTADDSCQNQSLVDLIAQLEQLLPKSENPANSQGIAGLFKSGRRDSNPRPLPPQGSALIQAALRPERT